MLKIRAGTGYDIHRLERGGDLVIGGIHVSNELHFVAHSDGDVLLHALMDALLGASGQADIGELFPDTDPRYRNISSSLLLKNVLERVHENGFEITNIDCTVVAQEPSLQPFKPAIRENLARLLKIPADAVGVKAKTREGLGAVGRVEAIECYCICMIRARTQP
ncbi:MAG: 2-C-methyl-D-erythritol 2,4-cyclodiphosphate synthase [Candidatus Aminicenantes bacterium]|nr:2-C-methyl-D-erythritol 2,4-cyclodiphosphate synthase [Candidatus Aminicenantes bacterium]